MIRHYQTFAEAFAIRAARPSPDHVVEWRQPAEGYMAGWLATVPAGVSSIHTTEASITPTKQGHLREAARDRSEGHRDRDALDGVRWSSCTLMDRGDGVQGGQLFTEFGRDDLDRQRSDRQLLRSRAHIMRWATALSRPSALAAAPDRLPDRCKHPRPAAVRGTAVHERQSRSLFAPLALAAVARRRPYWAAESTFPSALC